MKIHTHISYRTFKMFKGSLMSLILIQVIMSVSHVRAKVPAIIVFGDSYVDAGNNDYIPTIGRSNFAPYGRDFEGGKATGRFSDGRLWTDFASEAFGIKPAIPAYLDPSYSIKDFATGVTFASSGTGIDNLTSSVLNVIPLSKQLEYFKAYVEKLNGFMGEGKARIRLGEAVYIICIGVNDFVIDYYLLPVRSSEFTVDKYANFLVEKMERFVLDIYKLGARKIGLSGLNAIGCWPVVRTRNILHGRGCDEEFNKTAIDTNMKFKSLIEKLTTTAAGIRLAYLDAYGILVDAIQKPTLYGFENVSLGCCGTGTIELSIMCNKFTPFTCPDANKFIFWDSIHYTQKMGQIVSDYLMETALAQFL